MYCRDVEFSSAMGAVKCMTFNLYKLLFTFYNLMLNEKHVVLPKCGPFSTCCIAVFKDFNFSMAMSVEESMAWFQTFWECSVVFDGVCF